MLGFHGRSLLYPGFPRWIVVHGFQGIGGLILLHRVHDSSGFEGCFGGFSMGLAVRREVSVPRLALQPVREDISSALTGFFEGFVHVASS